MSDVMPTSQPVVYKLLDVVVTLVDVPDVSGHTVPAGTVGTIMEVFTAPCAGYMIEFPDDEDLSLPILLPEQIAPWVPNGPGGGASR